MGVASGCGEQEVGVASGSGWNLWVWLLGVVLRRYIDFLILLIPTPLVSVLFCSSIPTSFFILLKYIIHSGLTGSHISIIHNTFWSHKAPIYLLYIIHSGPIGPHISIIHNTFWSHRSPYIYYT